MPSIQQLTSLFEIEELTCRFGLSIVAFSDGDKFIVKTNANFHVILIGVSSKTFPQEHQDILAGLDPRKVQTLSL